MQLNPCGGGEGRGWLCWTPLNDIVRSQPTPSNYSDGGDQNPKVPIPEVAEGGGEGRWSPRVGNLFVSGLRRADVTTPWFLNGDPAPGTRVVGLVLGFSPRRSLSVHALVARAHSLIS